MPQQSRVEDQASTARMSLHNCSAAAYVNALCTTACRFCAERNLLNAWIQKAQRQNVPRHQIVHWIRRKAGPELVVWRQLADGTLGRSVPCLICKSVLEVFDLRVTCVVGQGSWFRGRLTDQGAPASKLTAAQKQQMQGKRRSRDRAAAA